MEGSPRMQETDGEFEGSAGVPRSEQHRTTVEGHRPAQLSRQQGQDGHDNRFQ